MPPLVEPLPDHVSFTVEQLTDASEKWRTNRAVVTDHELSMLAVYDKDLVRTGHMQREKAREQARAAELAKGLAALRPPPATHDATSVATVTTADVERMKSGDDGIEAWLQKNRDLAVPCWFIDNLFDSLKKQHHETKEARAIAASRIQILETENSALKARVEGMEANIRELRKAKGVSNVRWAGTFTPGSEYHQGELCTRNGLWLAKQTTTSPPGSDPSSWQLIVHRRLVPKDDGDR